MDNQQVQGAGDSDSSSHPSTMGLRKPVWRRLLTSSYVAGVITGLLVWGIASAASYGWRTFQRLERERPAHLESGELAPVRIEGYMAAANRTAKSGNYAAKVTAQDGDRLEFYIYYYNMENPDSRLIAVDLNVKVTPPTELGDCHWRYRIGAKNSNTLRGSVCLKLPKNVHAYYQPGFATWQHNAGAWSNRIEWRTEIVSDKIVGPGIRIENAPPCGPCWAHINFNVNAVGV